MAEPPPKKLRGNTSKASIPAPLSTEFSACESLPHQHAPDSPRATRQRESSHSARQLANASRPTNSSAEGPYPRTNVYHDAPVWSSLNEDYNRAHPEDPCSALHPRNREFLDNLRRESQMPILPCRERRQKPWRSVADNLGNIEKLRGCLTKAHVYEYDLDEPDSDNEDAALALRRRPMYQHSNRALDIDYEVFLCSVTYHNLVNGRQCCEAENDVLRGTEGEAFLKRFLVENEGLLDVPADMCRDAVAYADLLKCIIYIEVHFSIVQELHKKFPKLKDLGPAQMKVEVDTAMPLFVRLTIKKLEKSALLFNFKSTSTQPGLNKQLIEEFTGMTLCIGFLRRYEDDGEGQGERDSDLMFFVCRSVSYEDDDVDETSTDRSVDMVHVRIAGNRPLLESWGPEKNDVLFILPICSLASYHRMFRGVHDICRLPDRLLDTIFGPNIPQAPGSEETRSAFPRTEIMGDSNVNHIREMVDKGSLQYLDSLKPTECNTSQRNAIVHCLGEMGGLGARTSSMSAIVGPPGTGKTTSISLLTGALLHHSVVGHVGKDQRNLLGVDDGILRCSSSGEAIRILICSASNHAVDNVCRKLVNGISDGKGGIINANVVRVGRFNYNYGNLQHVSHRAKGLQFDHLKFRKDIVPPVTSPSSKAMRALGKEAVIVCCTLSTAGSSVLNDLRMPFDVVIIEEAAHASEAESCVGIAAACRHSMKRGLDRLHIVQVGDHKQLPPVFMSQHSVQMTLSNNRRLRLKTPWWKHLMSMFERLVQRGRCPVSWLCAQYRMHPHLGTIQFRQVYDRLSATHPSDIDRFQANFNDGSVFRPLTFVDTQKRQTRRERNDGDGAYVNTVEAHVINSILQKLAAFAPQGRALDPIFVTAPYHSQVDFLREYLYDPGNALKASGTANCLDVAVETIDSLQGLERPIVIVSLTRSNQRRMIGFMRDERRMNVATSRAQKLLIVVGDSHTLSKHCGIVRNFWTACYHEEPGAKLIFSEPVGNWDVDKERVQEVKELEKNIRGPEGYNLRHRDGRRPGQTPGI